MSIAYAPRAHRYSPSIAGKMSLPSQPTVIAAGPLQSPNSTPSAGHEPAQDARMRAVVDLSVVIPVYNEEEGLPALFTRLYPALDALGIAYEVIFVNDGSRDRSAAILKDQYLARPDVTRVVLF